MLWKELEWCSERIQTSIWFRLGWSQKSSLWRWLLTCNLKGWVVVSKMKGISETETHVRKSEQEKRTKGGWKWFKVKTKDVVSPEYMSPLRFIKNFSVIRSAVLTTGSISGGGHMIRSAFTSIEPPWLPLFFQCNCLKYFLNIHWA